MNKFWKKDKIIHLVVAMICAFILDIVLYMFIGDVADVITIVVMLAAIVIWENLPRRTFSVGDMIAGTLGLFLGLVLEKIFLIIGYYLIGK